MAIKLSEVAEGSMLLLNENGSPVEFYVAKHEYESGLNGNGRTLVVRKEVYGYQAWNTTNVNTYKDSTIDVWLNGEYKALFAAPVQDMIGATTFEYTVGNGDTTVTTLARGIFLLSGTELNKTGDFANVEGEPLLTASLMEIALMNGAAVSQWTRTASIQYTVHVGFLSTTGVFGVDQANVASTYGARPAFTLPASTAVSQTADGYALAMAVDVPSTLGSKRTAFSFAYSVTNPGGGTVDIVETLDGVTIGEKTGVASGAEVECTVDEATFEGLADATEHTIVITATNSDGLTATAEVKFRKQVALMSFEQYISENKTLRQTLADTLTEKGVEASGNEGYASLVPKVGSIEAGTKLPTLSNPATASEILSGYEAIDGDGNLVVGEMEKGYQLTKGTVTFTATGTKTITGTGFLYAIIAHFSKYGSAVEHIAISTTGELDASQSSNPTATSALSASLSTTTLTLKMSSFNSTYPTATYFIFYKE